MRLLSIGVLLVAGCAGRPVHGELVEADVVVPREGAKALAATLSMKAGHLDVYGGTCNLMQAKLRYDSATSTPAVDYAVDAQGFGELTVREEGTRPGRAATWKVCVTRELPLELDIDLGAGDTGVVLEGVQLRSLAIDIGAGDVRVDLRKAILATSTVSVDGGTGNLQLAVPANVGVRVEADKGVGGLSVEGLHRDGNVLVNDLWGESDLSVDVQVDLGVGQISVAAE